MPHVATLSPQESRPGGALDRPVARLRPCVGAPERGGLKATMARRLSRRGHADVAAADANLAIELLVVEALLLIGRLDRDAGCAADEATDHRADRHPDGTGDGARDRARGRS